MTIAAPRPLHENTGLAFLGERRFLAAFVPPKMAERMLCAHNPHGKSNADVLRQLATAAGSRRPGALWQIDFPTEMDEPEASLYAHPFRHLYRTGRSTTGRWWVNPHANHRLRATLAKRERYLATPLDADLPDFRWFEATLIPDDTLLAVARDDDFTHGVLQSRPFALWWRQFHSRCAPARTVESFPFPWPLSTTLSALTATQEEHRHAVARAARGNNPEQLDAAVARAYVWPVDLMDNERLARLLELTSQRSG